MQLTSGWIQVTPSTGTAVTYINTTHLVEFGVSLANPPNTILRFYDGTHTEVLETVQQIFTQMMTGQA